MNYSSGASISTAPTLKTNGSGSLFAMSSSDSASFEENWKIQRQQYQNRWVSANEECFRQSSTQFLGSHAVDSNENYVYMNDTYDQQRRAAIIAHNRRMQYLTDQLNSSLPTLKTVHVVPRIPQSFHPAPDIRTGKKPSNEEVHVNHLKKLHDSVVTNGERTANTSTGGDSMRQKSSIFRYFAKLFACTSSAAAHEAVVDPRSAPSRAFTASTLSMANDSADSVMEPAERLPCNSHVVDGFPSLQPDCCEQDNADCGDNQHYDGFIPAHYADYSHFADNIVEPTMNCGYTANPQQRDLLRRWNQQYRPRSAPSSPQGGARVATRRHWDHHSSANITLCRSQSDKCPSGPMIQTQVHLHRRSQEPLIVNQQHSAVLVNPTDSQQYLHSSENQRMQASLYCSSEDTSSRSPVSSNGNLANRPTPKTSSISRMTGPTQLSSTLPPSIALPEQGIYYRHSTDISSAVGSLPYSQPPQAFYHRSLPAIPNYALPVPSSPRGILIQSSMHIADESERSDHSAEGRAFLDSISQCTRSVAPAAVPIIPLTLSALSQHNRLRDTSTEHQSSQRFVRQDTDANAQPIVDHNAYGDDMNNEDGQCNPEELERAIQQSLEDENQRRRQSIRDRLSLNRAFIESMRDLQSQEVISAPSLVLKDEI